MSLNVPGIGKPVGDRPLVDRWITELELIADEHWDNPQVLFSVFNELLFRRPRQRQRLLTQRVNDRLLELASQAFRWPTTLASIGQQPLVEVGWPEDGLLGYLGYKVGAKGRTDSERRHLLSDAYFRPAPSINDSAYMSDWGQPASGPRLRKIAVSIAAFCRNAKRRNHDGRLDQAITDWENDLAFLKAKYYNGRYDFEWPRT